MVLLYLVWDGVSWPKGDKTALNEISGGYGNEVRRQTERHAAELAKLAKFEAAQKEVSESDA